MERIGVFGGSFNPLTQAHLMLAEHMLGKYTDRVLFLPVGDSYHKDKLVPASHRVAMLKMAVDRNPRFVLSELEINESGESKTFTSLCRLQQEYPEDKLFFIMGSDQLEGIDRWFKVDNLLQEFLMIVIARAEDDLDVLFASSTWLEERRGSFIICNDHPRTNLSSSHIRCRIAEGLSIRYLTLQGIIDYIHLHSLYTT